MGKGSQATGGYWYRPAFHIGLGARMDAFLGVTAAGKTAWSGNVTQSGYIHIEAPNLFGGQDDQGGISGDLQISFGEPTQQPDPYLKAVFSPRGLTIVNSQFWNTFLTNLKAGQPLPADLQGAQVPAWRGLATVSFRGGWYGANNPYPQKPSFLFRAIKVGWEGDVNWDGSACWYPEKAEVPLNSSRAPVSGSWPWVDWNTGYFLIGTSKHLDGPYAYLAGWWHGYVDCIRIRRGAYYAIERYSPPGSAFVYDNSTMMLLNMAGTDGSTQFIDDAGHAVTAFSGAHITTAKSKFGNSSAYFDGVDDYLNIAMGADEALGNGPWTMDAWVWLESVGSTAYGATLFGYGDKTTTGHDTAWMVNGTEWRYDQQQAIGVLQPDVSQNIGAAKMGGWSFVSICWDGARYWLHQDGQLLTIDPNAALKGMNPAHILYYARTHSELGRDPVEAIDDASFRVGADWFYNQGIGFCTDYDPGSESVDDFTQRISKVAGCSVNRSPVDGKWYLDIANGVYDLAGLPILNDDDVLDFSETPTTLDSAVNSVSVEYYDPVADATVLTPAVEAMSLIDSFGRNHQDIQYHEVPTAGLATRFAQRDEQAFVTPTRKFDLTTTRKPYSWRRNTYFRLQTRKRGIADMVCIIAGIESGTLKSGAMKLTVAQDTYSLPMTSLVQVDTGIDTRPSQIPLSITQQIAFEAPYFEVVRSLSRADLTALPDDAGYLLTAASDPATSRDYTVTVSTDGGSSYVAGGTAPWCPTALIMEGDTLQGGLRTTFTLAGGMLLLTVQAGAAALWDGEICRVDAIDTSGGTITLARGCADTVPVGHAVNSRIWFFDGFTGTDDVEYTDGEDVSVKLLTNTGSAQVDPALSTPLTVVFSGRQSRPYVPGNLTINSTRYPASITGGLSLAWSHRNRVTQADQLIDTTAAEIAPETGAVDTLNIYGDTDALLRSVDVSGATGYAYTQELEDMGGTPDPYAASVKALLHFDGPNNAQVYTDDVGNAWGANGSSNVSVLDTSWYAAGTASLRGPGAQATGIVTTANIGSVAGDFTVEAFVRVSSFSGWVNGSLAVLGNEAAGRVALMINQSGQLTYNIYGSGSIPVLGTGVTVPITTTPVHLAFVRSGGNLLGFVDGALVGSVALSGALGNAGGMRFGSNWNGWIDDWRFTNGVARYTAAFTPPLPPLGTSGSAHLNGRLRIELASARGTITSLRKHDIVVRRSGYGYNYGMFYGGTP